MILAKILALAVLFGIVMIYIRLRARRENPGGACAAYTEPTKNPVHTVKAGNKFIVIGSQAANPADPALNADQKAVADAMKKLLAEGKLIEAVQFVRQHRNSSLKEAVAAVKEMQQADEKCKQDMLQRQRKP